MNTTGLTLICRRTCRRMATRGAGTDAMLARDAAHRRRGRRGVCVRPVRPADAEAIQAFVRGLSAASRRARFFGTIRELAPGMLARLTAADAGPDRVFIVVSHERGTDRVVALAQYAADDDGASCELALVLADDWQGRGLGRLLLDMLIETARDAGFTRAEADVLRGNAGMLGLARAFGFSVMHSPHDATLLRIALDLDEHSREIPAARAARPSPHTVPVAVPACDRYAAQGGVVVRAV